MGRWIQQTAVPGLVVQGGIRVLHDRIYPSAPPKGPAASRPHTGAWSFAVRVEGDANVRSMGGAWGMAPGASEGRVGEGVSGTA